MAQMQTTPDDAPEARVGTEWEGIITVDGADLVRVDRSGNPVVTSPEGVSALLGGGLKGFATLGVVLERAATASQAILAEKAPSEDSPSDNGAAPPDTPVNVDTLGKGGLS